MTAMPAKPGNTRGTAMIGRLRGCGGVRDAAAEPVEGVPMRPGYAVA